MDLVAGQLNRRLTIQSPSDAQDEFGQPLNQWTDVVTTWGSIRAATGKEVYAASTFVSQLSHVIKIRWRSGMDIRSNMRVKYRDRAFRIQAVSDPDEGRVVVNLLCLEINEGR